MASYDFRKMLSILLPFCLSVTLFGWVSAAPKGVVSRQVVEIPL